MDALSRWQAPAPALAPLPMPVQSLSRHSSSHERARSSVATFLARLLAFGGAIALTAYACREMLAVMAGGHITVLQYVLVALFTVTFGWIAFAATGAIAGLLLGWSRSRRVGVDQSSRTALLMPICNEDPARSFAALYAMGRSLLERNAAAGFEIFVLSDTSRPETWIKETAAYQALREALGDGIRVWYRRREHNVGRKAGNIADFVTRWGARYEHMVVLDADSLLAADALLALRRDMWADPKLALLQTAPRLCGGTTLYARLQQFASAVYGPIVARGVAAWQGNGGNYWGHNAIIRVRAFAEAAGLPELPGRKPFGGQILSHDFVEAALLRRAGWSVRMLPNLGGSWEESPPSLLDAAVRDRRWAQGNVQHLAVIGASGLSFISRIHLALGVMSYLASPLWLALIGVGLAVSTETAVMRYEYFGDEPTLFPRWAVFDTERMLRLLLLSMAILLLPKCLGLLRALVNRELLRTVGVLRLLAGTVLEVALAALYAPISMLMQTRQLWEIVRGHDSGWSTQSRQQSTLRWRTLWQRHRLHTAVGLLLGGALAVMSLPLLAWMAPALLGLVLALPLSAASGSVWIGKATRALGLLTVPEEIDTPAVMRTRDEFEQQLHALLEGVSLDCLLSDPAAVQAHLAATLPRAVPQRGRPDLTLLSARAKLADAHGREEALEWLTAPELAVVLGDRELLTALERLPDSAAQTAGEVPGSASASSARA
jgi:membrane glycosyltransferase